MLPKSHKFLAIILTIFCAKNSFAVTLTSAETSYSTTADITTDDSGIISSSSGSSSSFRSITNNHIITTGNSGANSSAYGIRVSGDYYSITNSSGAEIITTGSSGRGISVSDFATISNAGSIITQGTTAYGIYGGGSSNSVSNSGSITTAESSAHGIYLNGDSNSANNSGAISTSAGYGIYLNGSLNSFVNSGSILTSSGSTAYGIYISAGATLTADSSNFTTITNSGSVSSNSHAIYNKDNYVNIANSGTLSVASSSSIYGIKNEADNVVITNSGSISATKYAIYNSGQNITINNSGTLSGAVFLGSGTLNISGGTISGLIDGDGQQGSVEIASGVSFAQISNFSELSKLTINSAATLTSAATIDASNIEIGDGAILELSSGFAISGATIFGASSGIGILNIGSDFDVVSSAVTLGNSSNSLDEINVSAAATLDVAQNIYAQNLNIYGNFNFNQADSLEISGNFSVLDGAVVSLGENSQKIGGNFTLNENSELQISMQENGAGVGNFAVSGDVEISSAAKLQITTNSNQGYIPSGTEFRIIQAADVTKISQISDDNISLNSTNSNLSGLLEYQTAIGSDGLYLKLQRLDKDLVTQNENLQNIYQNLDEIGANSQGYLLDFQEYLDSGTVDATNADEALSQLRPNSNKMAFSTTFSALDNALRSVEKRLDSAKEVNLWIHPLGFVSQQSAIKNDAAFGLQSIGAIFGFDAENDDSRFGGFLGYLRSEAKTKDNLQQNSISTFLAGAYIRKDFAHFFFDNLGAFAAHQFDARRDIKALSIEAISQYWGESVMNKFRFGWEKKLAHGLKLIPQSQLIIAHGAVSGYEEKGAKELNLQVGNSVSSYADLRFGGALAWKGKIPEVPEIETVAAEVKLSYGGILFAKQPKSVVSFSGQNSTFSDNVSQIIANSIKFGASFSGYCGDGTSLSLNYDLEKRSGYQSHLILAKINQSF